MLWAWKNKILNYNEHKIIIIILFLILLKVKELVYVKYLF